MSQFNPDTVNTIRVLTYRDKVISAAVRFGGKGSFVDNTAKGGVAISIGKDLGIPVFYVCTGETYSDISLFNCDDYLNTFLGL